MRVTQERPEDRALVMDECAAILGLAPFSLFSRVQTGDIQAVRARSGEMLIPSGEVERLVNGFANKSSVQADTTLLPDETLGIRRRHGGLGNRLAFFKGPGFEGRLWEQEINSYRAAASAIAAPLESLKALNRQLGGENPPSESGEIDTPETGRWEIRSSLLRLIPGEILLCRRGDEFAAIERFGGDSPFAKMNGPAQMLWEGDDAQGVAGAFRGDARLTLEFMANNLTAKAQRIIWEQFPDQRPGHVVAAITERCHEAITNEETIKVSQRIGRGICI